MTSIGTKEIVRLAPGEQGFARFALQVMSILVGDTAHHDRPPKPELLSLLVRGAMTGDPAILASLTSEFRRHRVPAEVVVDVYLPAAVDEIGAAWHDDVIDILDATVATTRLQNLLRELGRAWHADDSSPAGEGSVLMIAPEGEQHVLGALIAAAQLRRRGISVTVELCPPWPRIEERLINYRFDAVFLSVGNYDSLEKAATIVKTIRGRMKLSVPVLAGGSIPMDMDVVRRAIGADFATRDIRAALEFLGLREALHAAQ